MDVAGWMSTSSAPDLPPCRVCGDRATGFHYGVNSCEACKGFFKRGVEKGGQYICLTNKDCKIHPGNKSLCPFCRFQKCLSVGMSLQKIRRGRYTLEKKTENIKVMKRLERQAPIWTGDTFKNEEQLDSFLFEIKKSYQILKVYTEEDLASIPRQQMEFLENERIHEAKYGKIHLLDKEDYKQVLDLTGLDIDGRKGLLVSYLPLLEDSVIRVVKFAKSLPGFSLLQQEDKIMLLKAHHNFCRIFHSVKGVNCEQGLYTSDTNLTMSKDELERVIDVTWANAYFDIAKVINRVNPSDEEAGIIAAIAMFATDDCDGLEDPVTIQELQNKFIELLHYVVEKNSGQSRLARLLMILPELRTYAMSTQIRDNVFIKFYGVDMPKIILELM